MALKGNELKAYLYMTYHNRGITCQECYQHIGTTELRRIISRLKEKGYNITDRWIDDFNKFGQPVRYKRYYCLGKMLNS